MPTEQSVANYPSWLPAELKAARNEAGLTQKQVADLMDWSQSKMLRIEAGKVGISTVDLIALLNCYSVIPAGRKEELVEVVRKNNR
jgi:transcriptional regulator with XRE-family HTH domain